MKRRIFTSLAAGAAVAASILITGVTPAAAQPATADSSAARSSAVTPNSQLNPLIRVDETQFKIVATLKGIGKQVYDCNSGGTFSLREPVAVLVNLRSGNAGIHGATTGPTAPFWASFDGSRVVGNTTPGTPGFAAIDAPVPTRDVRWVKLPGTSVGASGVFSKVAFVQRIDTRGGVAPTSCVAPATASVDYSTNYVFWAPKP